jgi:O-antigen ligase
MGAAGVLVAAVLVPWISQLRPTLGARFLIWQLVVGKLSDEFPLPPQSRWIDSEEAANALGFSPTHSHNALLDLFLIYGILPTIVFVTAMVGAIVTVRHLESRNWTRSNLESPVVRGVLIYMLVHSTVESMFLAGPVGALMCGVAGGLALATGGKSFAPGGAVGTKSRRKQ